MRLISLRKLISNPSYGKLVWKSYYRKPNIAILFLTTLGIDRSLQNIMYHLINHFIFIHWIIIKGSLIAKHHTSNNEKMIHVQILSL